MPAIPDEQELRCVPCIVPFAKIQAEEVELYGIQCAIPAIIVKQELLCIITIT